MRARDMQKVCTLQKLLEKFNDYNKKKYCFEGDLNLIFDCKFDASGGNLMLKKISSETN